MVLSQVARLAYAASVKLTVFMLTEFCFLDTAFRVIAILAHTTCIVGIVDVLALSDLLAMLNFSLLFLPFTSSRFLATP